VKTGAPSKPCFKLDQTFFGYNREDRVILHEQLFNLLWIGEGKWDWDTLYNMPIFLRNFYIKKIDKLNHDRQQAQEKTKSSKDVIAKPPF
jgi:hypothetical protein